MPPSPMAVVARRALRTPKAKWPGADRGFLEQVGVLHQHLHRHAGRQHVHQRGVLGRVVAIGRDADEVVREQREVVGRQRVLVIALEERVVVGLVVAAARLQLGDRDRLHQLDEARQPRAVAPRWRPRSCRTRTSTARPARRSPGHRDRRAGCAARRAPTRCARAAPPAARPSARCARPASTSRRSRTTSACRPPTAGLQRLRLLARLRVHERRAQDVGQLADQVVDERAERARLLAPALPPRAGDEARRQARVAVDQLAVDRQRTRRRGPARRATLSSAPRRALRPPRPTARTACPWRRPRPARGARARAAAGACAGARPRCRAARVRRSARRRPTTATRA